MTYFIFKMFEKVSNQVENIIEKNLSFTVKAWIISLTNMQDMLENTTEGHKRKGLNVI